MEIKYYNKGFYIEGVHGSIPKEAITITKERHEKIINGLSNGMELSEDSQGNPILVEVKQTIEEWKEEKLNEINLKFHTETALTPISYKNGLNYFSEDSMLYSTIMSKYTNDEMTLDIWDASGTLNGVKKMNKSELLELALFLADYYESSFQSRKKNIAYINEITKQEEIEQFENLPF